MLNWLLSINTFLVSLFSEQAPKATDPRSLLRYYQTLVLIYCNLTALIATIVWNFLSRIIPGIPCEHVNSIILPMMIASLLLLHNNKIDLAAVIFLIYSHVVPIILSCTVQGPFAALPLTILCPALGFLISSSPKIHTMNFLLCLLHQFIPLVAYSNDPYMTVEERNAKYIGQISFIFRLTLLGVFCFNQKSIETRLWTLAQSNFERAEKINKEFLQAVEAKDAFVSSLSHEIRNPLNAIKGSIDYLISELKSSKHLQILENAKMGGEVLLNLLNNVLDVAKLRADKMELSYSETDFMSVIKKIFMINCECLKNKNIEVKVSIDKNLPPILWVDSSRLLQIILNLFSNALKFTPNNGKISLKVLWQPNDQNKQDLLVYKNVSETSLIFDESICESEAESFSPLARPQSTSLSKLLRRESCYDVLETDEFGNGRRKNGGHTQVSSYILNTHVNEIFRNKHTNIKITDTFLEWTFNNHSGSVQELVQAYSQISNNNTVPYATEGFLKIEIADSGCGIAKENTSKLFTLFSQADKKVSSTHGGTGLGLFICKQLCHKMGGDISLHTKFNKGTAVVFYIPIDNSYINAAEKQKEAQAVHQKKRVLVVDDYAYNRDVHKLLLEREGFEVTLAENGKEAVDCYSGKGKQFFDFIMMDVQMPVMNGFEAVKAIRSYETKHLWNLIDIYLVSGEYYNEDDILKELKASGHNEKATGLRCLRKPIDVDAIKVIRDKSK